MKKFISISLAILLVISLAGCSNPIKGLIDFDGIKQSGDDLLQKFKLDNLFGSKDDSTVSIETTSVTEAPETEPAPTEPTAPREDNPYYTCWVEFKDYVLPESSTKYYSRGEINTLSPEALEIAKQEIYARHQKAFTDSDLQDYFSFRDWYQSGIETELTAVEEANLFLLENFQKEQAGEPSLTLYVQYLDDPTTYLAPDSNRRYLCEDDMRGLNYDQVELILNEIYARRGCIFERDDLRAYFYSTDWYSPYAEFSTDVFNKYEEGNIEICKLYERKLQGVKFSSKNKYKVCYYGPNTMMISYSSDQYLTYSFLDNFTDEELVIARNEIGARHGYAFTNKDMQEFFLQCDWYYPCTPPGESDLINYTEIEQYNRSLIREVEAARGKT